MPDPKLHWYHTYVAVVNHFGTPSEEVDKYKKMFHGNPPRKYFRDKKTAEDFVLRMSRRTGAEVATLHIHNFGLERPRRYPSKKDMLAGVADRIFVKDDVNKIRAVELATKWLDSPSNTRGRELVEQELEMLLIGIDYAIYQLSLGQNVQIVP